MPSETHYLPDEIQRYVKEYRDREGLDNNSRAVQEIVKDHRDEIGESDE